MNEPMCNANHRNIDVCQMNVSTLRTCTIT